MVIFYHFRDIRNMIFVILEIAKRKVTKVKKVNGQFR